MEPSARILSLCCLAISLAGTPGAFSQEADDADVDAMAARVRQLERQVLNLDTLLRSRTDVPGPTDRINRDYSLDGQLDQIERRIRQIENELLNLQRQVSDALRIANQAQNEAQAAQQTARDAAARVR